MEDFLGMPNVVTSFVILLIVIIEMHKNIIFYSLLQ